MRYIVIDKEGKDITDSVQVIQETTTEPRPAINENATIACVLDEPERIINKIKEWSRNLNTKDRALMLSKLIVKEAPVQSKIEKETMAWLGTLSQKELKYVWWVKEYFEGLNKLIDS